MFGLECGIQKSEKGFVTLVGLGETGDFRLSDL